MARIVYLTNGLASTRNAALELGRRMIARGHAVHLVEAVADGGTAASSFASLAASIGASPHRLCEKARLEARARTEGPSAELRRLSIEDNELERLLGDLRPDLLLIDAELHACIVCCLPLGIPIALPIVWFTIFRHPGLPPLHVDRQPSSTGSARLRNEASWWSLFARRRLRDWMSPVVPRKRALRRRPLRWDVTDRKSLQELAQSKGLDLERHTDQGHWLAPHVWRRLPVLSYTLGELDFEHEADPRLRYLGPMVWQGGGGDEDAEALQRFAAFRSALSGRVLVYASLGTFWEADRKLLSAVLEACRRDDRALVLGLGGKLSPGDLGAVPDNVLLLARAPQNAVLEHAQVAVTHGGITTIHECLAHGVPLVVCSTGHVDQDGCAARLRHHRLARVLGPHERTAREIADAIASVREDETLRARVSNVQEAIARAQADATAERAVEALLLGAGETG